ncbi:terminase [Nanchangia anserum]|uniref:Terminase n=1 Tax=Nanchangia anserum TaxID=2692125 RepID=A0A8I0G8I2_9ACTO|nr:terminase large subunit [Nanchangia anserum]MBD3689865.1 terminase [Nanchangia anserum]QOX82032.1 terminase [Nanchangia anserum]
MNSLNDAPAGAQRPRLESFPPYFTSAGEDAIDLAAAAGLNMDEWQRYVLTNALGETSGQKWAAMEVGLVVPRQNGKNMVLIARELAGALLFGESLIVHSAHEFRTCTAAFDKTWEIIKDSPLVEYVAGWEGDAGSNRIRGVKRAHGFEALEFSNGARIQFMTRTAHAARGFTADTLIIDEAYALKDEQLGALIPTMAAQSIKGNPQIWYTSSAGMASSGPLESLRNRGAAGNDRQLAYFEWSAEADADPDDPDAWAQANPALGIHIAPNWVASERASMDEEQFKRERLGIWAIEQEDPPVIAPESWQKCRDEESRPGEKVVFAVDVTPKRDAAVIVAASARPDGRVHVEVVAQNDGPWWVAQWLGERFAANKYPGARVVIDNGSAAAVLVPELGRYRVPVAGVNFREYAQSCGAFFDAIESNKIAHIGQTQLDEAVEAARVKPVGESLWKWIRRAPGDDISPLVAASLAFFAIHKNARPATKRRTRRVVLC